MSRRDLAAKASTVLARQHHVAPGLVERGAEGVGATRAPLAVDDAAAVVRPLADLPAAASAARGAGAVRLAAAVADADGRLREPKLQRGAVVALVADLAPVVAAARSRHDRDERYGEHAGTVRRARHASRYARRHGPRIAAVARRDEIIAYADELLDVASFPDYGPVGMQVAGAQDVTKIACAVSASREVFERAAAAGAQLLLVHHGLFWDSDARVVDEQMKRRLQALFDADLTLAAYHLALDAHPDIGNNALLARELGAEVERSFAKIGVGASLREPVSVADFAARVRDRLGREPLVFAHGPDRITSIAIISGGGGKSLPDAARERYDLFLTGEPEEPSLYAARELGIHFVAAGHYVTERLGVQALAKRLAERFALEWEFIEVSNPV